MAYTLIKTVEVGSGGATNIQFLNIQQEAGADLVVKLSARDTQAATINRVSMVINSDTAANYATKYLWATGSSAVNAFSTAGEARLGYFSGNSSSANTFGNGEAFIQNYTSTVAKNIFGETVAENNATLYQGTLTVTGYTGTDPITSLELVTNGTAFAEHTTASLYLVTTTDASGATNLQPKATGGTISYANGYWTHKFYSSDTFTPTETLTCDYLVVAGGGGGGAFRSGGGGAGGYRTSVGTSGGGGGAESALVLAATSYSVTVGAGGAGASGTNNNGANGSNSIFNTITSLGGGGGGGGNNNASGNAGGSGGGAAIGTSSGSGGAGTAGQGYAGGNNSGAGDGGKGGGGGGAAEAGNTDGQSFGGDGVTSSLDGTQRGGGGGGCLGYNYRLDNIQNAGAGGGGIGATNGRSPGSGVANTGGGGGGAYETSAAGSGGSGIVIVRYAA